MELGRNTEQGFYNDNKVIQTEKYQILLRYFRKFRKMISTKFIRRLGEVLIIVRYNSPITSHNLRNELKKVKLKKGNYSSSADSPVAEPAIFIISSIDGASVMAMPAGTLN